MGVFGSGLEVGSAGPENVVFGYVVMGDGYELLHFSNFIETQEPFIHS